MSEVPSVSYEVIRMLFEGYQELAGQPIHEIKETLKALEVVTHSYHDEYNTDFSRIIARLDDLQRDHEEYDTELTRITNRLDGLQKDQSDLLKEQVTLKMLVGDTLTIINRELRDLLTAILKKLEDDK